MRFDVATRPSYPLCMARAAFVISLVLFTGVAQAQMVAFVAPGEDPPRTTSRAVLRGFELLDGRDDVEVIDSMELRRALAGLPASADQDQGDGAADSGDDPLADVRRLLRRARGDRLSSSLERLGGRIGADLIITVRQVGREVELRGFNVERSAFYRGTLMLPAASAPDAERVTEFVMPRVAAARSSATHEEPQAEEGEERPRRRNRWWIWVIVGGAVAAAAVISVLVQPDEVEDTGVTVRIVPP